MYHRWSRPFISTVLSTLLVGAQSVTAAPSNSTQPPREACGTIVNDPDGAFFFDATLVYECLTSVPFNPAVATRFLRYYNDTLSFHSTLSYLKDPPSTYQQPSVDLLGGLQSLQYAVNSGSFANQYEFEVALQLLLLNAHDDHLYLNAGILSAFSFGSPFDIVSLSVDGVETPKVYIASDVFESNAFTSYEPSAIKLINGQDATAYLETFAAGNVAGSVDPDTDWNRLMFSFAQDIQGFFNVFSGLTPFYPGETITIELENGTTFTERNLGIYFSQGPTGPLETGGDFYNFFVLGFLPASFDPNVDFADPTVVDDSPTTVPSEVVTPPPLSWNSPAYPEIPDVAQPDLGLIGGGVLSGYFLNSSSVSVLSIPSFDVFDDALSTAQTTVTEFIRRTQAAGLQRVVIDLQQNKGGQVLLAVNIFKQFFPNIEPFGGSRLRAHHATDVMGQAITDRFNQLSPSDSDFAILSPVEWVATTRIDAETNSSFASWSQFFGPVISTGDAFTRTQRFNFSNEIFVDSLIGNEGNFSVISTPSQKATPPWAPEDIIILTDGDCSSACALFVEMMHHEAGVRIVTVGGKPTTGPMQAVGGTRGARSFSTDILDNNINFARELLEGTSDADFLPNRTEALDIFVLDGSINLRDQVRRGETVPLQFAYEAANCRIYFTPQTIFNYTALWMHAADAIWTNPGLCVAGSTGYATSSKTNGSSIPPPVPSTPAFNIADHVTIDPDKSNSTVDVGDAGELAGDLLSGFCTRTGFRFRECREAQFDSSFMCKPILRCFGDTAVQLTAVTTCDNSRGSSCFTGFSDGHCVIEQIVPYIFPDGEVIDVGVGFCEPNQPSQCNSCGSIIGLTSGSSKFAPRQASRQSRVPVAGRGPTSPFTSPIRAPPAPVPNTGRAPSRAG
ncbi:hypothetical protein GQX73_g2397 [Xylaria multiplex]|uniref:Uncharacterized protein n=1 Tax=Xylaria multiplex TaxID=323545 RepID=A0A7C8IX37_9PEZI|nr:hypothetical protein GQX73_g2397 [Xylaria multiplex]